MGGSQRRILYAKIVFSKGLPCRGFRRNIMKKISLFLGCAALCVIILVLPTSAVTLPAASFMSNVTEGSAPLGVLFLDSSENSPTSWLWSFGDGGTSALQNPVHTYTGAGTYTVTLTASNSAGSNTDTETGYITVNKAGTLPVALFVANTTRGSLPLTVQFVDSSTNSPTSWLWSFGDGSTSTVQNPAHTYKTAGTYAVTLTVTNTKGANTLSQSGYIVVTEEPETPVASFAASETSGDAPLTVQFVDSSTNSPTSWLWSFGDGSTSALQNPSHTYTSAGTYTVTLTASNSAGSDTATESDYITVDLQAPVVTFSANTSSGAVPLTVNFTDTSTNSPTEWYWVFGDGSTSSDQNVIHTYTSAGTYTVKLVASNSEGSNKTTQTITVTGAVAVPVASFTSDVVSGTAPLAVQFTDTSTNSPTSWLWSFGDGSTSELQNPSHTYTSAGTYTVSLTAANAAGSNIVTRNDGITVTAAPVERTSEAPSAAVSSPPQVTEAAATTPTTDTSSGSSGLLPYAGVGVLVVAGILAWVFIKRPPRGPHHSGGKDL